MNYVWCECTLKEQLFVVINLVVKTSRWFIGLHDYRMCNYCTWNARIDSSHGAVQTNMLPMLLSCSWTGLFHPLNKAGRQKKKKITRSYRIGADLICNSCRRGQHVWMNEAKGHSLGSLWNLLSSPAESIFNKREEEEKKGTEKVNSLSGWVTSSGGDLFFHIHEAWQVKASAVFTVHSVCAVWHIIYNWLFFLLSGAQCGFFLNSALQ